MPSQQSFTAYVQSSSNCMRGCAQSSLSSKQGVLCGGVMEEPCPRGPG